MKSIVLPTPDELCLPLELTDQTVWALMTHSHEPWLPMKQAYLEGELWCDIPIPLGNRLELREESSYNVRAAGRRDLPVHLITLNTKALESTFLQTMSFCCKNEKAGRNNWKCLCFTNICQGWPNFKRKMSTSASPYLYPDPGKKEEGSGG